MPVRNDDPANRIIDLLHSAHRKLHSQITNSAKEGYTVPQILLLRELFLTPGISLNELSKKLSLSNSTVSGIVDRLQQQGAIERITPVDNRRKISLFLSDRLKKKGDLINHEKTRYMKELLRDSDIIHIEKLIESLEFLNGLLDK